MKNYQTETPGELIEMTAGKTLAQLQTELEYQQSMGETLGGNICSHIVYEMEKLRAAASLKPVLKTELSAAEIKTLERRIVSHFQNNPRWDRHGKLVYRAVKSQLFDYLGLAYTSTSSFAALWVCNEEVYLDASFKFTYGGFSMDAGGFCFAWLTDSEENELYIAI